MICHIILRSMSWNTAICQNKIISGSSLIIHAGRHLIPASSGCASAAEISRDKGWQTTVPNIWTFNWRKERESEYIIHRLMYIKMLIICIQLYNYVYVYITYLIIYIHTQLYNIIYTQKLHSSTVQHGINFGHRTPMASETPTRSATFNNAAWILWRSSKFSFAVLTVVFWEHLRATNCGHGCSCHSCHWISLRLV